MSFAQDWYAPAPSELPAARMTLHFGLRGDDLFFRNLVVPQAGGARFVRQLSWALAALTLASKAEATPPGSDAKLVAHALEAIGSKLEWWAEGQGAIERSWRVLGRRAFARDIASERWTFHELSRREHYVQNTRRQSVMRAISLDRGLGLALGTRYAEMRPVGLGAELVEAFLAQAFGRGGGKLGPKLLRWISRPETDDYDRFLNEQGALGALGPSTPTGPECHVVAQALYRGDTEQAETRRALAKIFGRYETWPDAEAALLPELREAGRAQQARHVEAARSFGRMLDSVIDLALAASEPIGSRLGRQPLAAVADDPQVIVSFQALRTDASEYRRAADSAGLRPPSANDFSDQVGSATRTRVVGDIMRRAPELFDVHDGSVGPGDLFRRLHDVRESQQRRAPDDELTDDEPVELNRAFSLDGFHELVRDCLPYGEATR